MDGGQKHALPAAPASRLVRERGQAGKARELPPRETIVRMTDLRNPEVIRLLACPDCGRDLFELDSLLRCTHCGREYEVRDGIPLLYPKAMDIGRLRGEEMLAEMMKRPRPSRLPAVARRCGGRFKAVCALADAVGVSGQGRNLLSSQQWENSKKEFWGMVRGKVAPPPKSLVNIGCGYDACFNEFQEAGHLFVNFDIVYRMLQVLQRDFHATLCVAGDLNSLPFKKGCFDYVVCVDVLHHESDKVRTLLQWFRDLLKPGGLLFLEDVNAWGMFQFPKSLFLPRPIHRLLRSAYHQLKRSVHEPAYYEFPTNVFRVRKILRDLNFSNISIHPNNAYPCIGPLSYRAYACLCRIESVRQYHNYHYMLSATKRGGD